MTNDGSLEKPDREQLFKNGRLAGTIAAALKFDVTSKIILKTKIYLNFVAANVLHMYSKNNIIGMTTCHFCYHGVGFRD